MYFTTCPLLVPPRANLPLFDRRRRSMDHHRHIHIIKRAEPDEFLFTSHQPHVSLFVQLPAVFHIDEFLGGQRHQRDISS